ncbi:MAG: alpha/beta fold hydrolase [Gemmatimonadaceae bacterium]|nr:alpha/beta fold hydrolase [Gemmatimonadaceae bacterium]
MRLLGLAALGPAVFAGLVSFPAGAQRRPPRTPPPAPAPAARATGAVSLDALLSAPLPSALTGVAIAGGKGRIAWASLERGARSVFVADVPGGTAKRIGHFPVDDGQDVSDVVLSGNGRAVAFVRGQGGNAQRESPNPSSAADGAEQAVWVSLDGQAARRIGAGASPRLSPTGDRVVWQRDSTLYVSPTTGAPAITPLFRARGVNSDARWSPDGSRIAFVSARGDHAFIGVFSVARREITWISPSVDVDRAPRWTADGKQLAFVRTPTGSTGGNLFAPTGGGGVQVLAANPDAGEARVLWTSPAGAVGRLVAPTAGESFMVAGNRALFFMEPNGWQHLFMLPLDGSASAPVSLTRGECEVEEPSITADGATVFVSANCGDLDRKHIWRVPADGSAEAMVVSSAASPMSPSIESTPVAAGGALAFLRGDAFLPAQVVASALTDGVGGAATAAPIAGAPGAPADFPRASELVIPELVLLTAADGQQIHAQLFQPQRGTSSPLTGVSGGRRPAVIFTHGGPMRQMLLGWHPRGYYARTYAMNQYLASRGYVVLSINYRLGVGYGRAFREAPKSGRLGAAELQDVVAGAKWLASRPDVDDARIGLWGGSYGGYLTAMALVKHPELFAAGVDVHGVHDWNAPFSSFAPTVVSRGREPDSVMTVGRASSPVCCVANLRAPLLLIHGDDDRNVSFSETVTFTRLLREAKKPVEVVVFPDEVHDFLRHDRWLAALRAGAEFFGRTIGRP